MMALNIEAAAQDLAGSVDYLLGLDETRGSRVGSVGFCMGGQLSLYAACANPRIGACVIYYGIHPKVQPDIPALESPVLGFFGEQDASVPPQAVRELDTALREAGKSVEFHIYPQRDHAFFNEVRPDVYHRGDAEDTWTRMIQFFRQHLPAER
jgi:carboxymethylenebutenolidase